MKHSFISMSLCTALLVCGACSNDNEIDNAGETGWGRVPLMVQATASSFNNLPYVAEPTTRTPVEDGLQTEFQTGDAIGIFALKDGAIVDGISNAKLIYSEASGAGSWNPAGGTTLYWYEGVSYIAYYPYKDGISIDASQTTDKIIASLAVHKNLQPTTDQQDAAKYTACDLMTASGTPTADAADAAKKILTLNFEHQFTLLVLKPQVFVTCIAPAGAGFAYRSVAKAPIMDAKAQNVTLNGVTACKMKDGSYRAIVVPNTTTTAIAGEYKTTNGVLSSANKTIVYSGNSNVFAAGNCYTLEVNSPFHDQTGLTTERALKLGDFVFHGNTNVEIYPGNGPLTNGKIPDYNNAVGMVTTCAAARMTDALCNSKGWSHAYVMGLENAGGTMNLGPQIDEDVLPNTIRDEGAENNMNGYTETEAMLAERVKKGDLAKYGLFNVINTYRTNNATPTALQSKRSPWFVPSVGQWYDVMVNICRRSPKTFRNNSGRSWIDNNYGLEMWNKINSQLNKVGKPLSLISVDPVVFLCSSEMDSERGWDAYWGNNATSVALGAADKAGTSLVRPFFAF